MNDSEMNEQEASPPNYSLEKLYQALFEQAVDGIFIANAQGHTIDVNSSGCKMSGYTRQEILNLSM
ncbi:MAG: PAS domain S-box protein, partial [Anaerolineae bacterium]